MKKTRLGINIDHIATIRNARGGAHPDPIRSIKIIEQAGGDGITAHLREDRRHIIDSDIFRIKEATSLTLNFEMAATEEMLQIALKVKPHACCLVPEKREEVTTEGGLDVAGNIEYLKKYCARIKSASIRVSLFIDPDTKQIAAAKEAGADIVELHTGAYCHQTGTRREKELKKIIEAAKQAEQAGIECHAGHGLTYETVSAIAAIPNIVELNIGHFLIGESLFIGLEESIKKMQTIIQSSRQEAK